MAFGWHKVSAATRVVINLNNSGAGSLRQAIADSGSGDSIVFTNTLSGTITLTSGALTISSSLTIAGPGAPVLAISGNGSSRVFSVTAGIFNVSGLTITNGFDMNSGGGINNASTTVVARCSFNANSAHDGGGINNASGASLTVASCAFVANLSDTGGGLANRGSAFITNSTFSGNLGNNGSGIYSSTLGLLRLANVTVAGNGNGASTYGGLYVFAGTAQIRNSLIALNSNSGFGGPDVTGTVVSDGYNLIGKTNDSSGWVASDLKGSVAAPLAPLLGPVQNNGGPTYTRALLPGSPAIDRGATGSAIDQRDNVRPYDDPGIGNAGGGNGSDIGAYEVGPGEIPTLVVYNNKDNGAGSLRQAITDVSIYNIPVITFATNVTGTITITGAQLVVTSTSSILGPGAKILRVNANGTNRVFSMNSGTVNISGLTIGNGFDNNRAGNIYNRTVLNLTNCSLTGGSSHDGGAVYNDTNGTLTVVGSTVFQNSGETGAGLYNRGNATLFNTTIASNGISGGVNGCAIYNRSNLTVLGCTVAANGNGSLATGGSFNNQASGTVNIRNTVVAGNVSDFAGPDVFGTFVSQGHNLIGKTNDSSGWTSTDLRGSVATPLNALLGPLQNNGGPTLTMAQLSGSPTLDAGVSGGLVVDQRGKARPFDNPGIPNAAGGDGSDIGAVELIPPFLTIERASPNVRILWPTNDIGFSLESATDLTNGVIWTAVPSAPAVLGDTYVVTNGPATGNKLYRLRK
jgi:hypothetical protein